MGRNVRGNGRGSSICAAFVRDGLDELSASVSVISEIKKIIRMMPYEKAKEIAQGATRLKLQMRYLKLFVIMFQTN
jgi:phosphoenolpyruvate-protein kinase (PTS system EI component)